MHLLVPSRRHRAASPEQSFVASQGVLATRDRSSSLLLIIAVTAGHRRNWLIRSLPVLGGIRQDRG
jgi:hypothetical protein